MEIFPGRGIREVGDGTKEGSVGMSKLGRQSQVHGKTECYLFIDISAMVVGT